MLVRHKHSQNVVTPVVLLRSKHHQILSHETLLPQALAIAVPLWVCMPPPSKVAPLVMTLKTQIDELGLLL